MPDNLFKIRKGPDSFAGWEESVHGRSAGITERSDGEIFLTGEGLVRP